MFCREGYIAEMEDFNDYLADIEDTEDIDVINNGGNRKMNQYKTRFDPFTLNDEDFKAKYRFTKQYIRIIVDVLKDLKQDHEVDP